MTSLFATRFVKVPVPAEIAPVQSNNDPSNVKLLSALALFESISVKILAAPGLVIVLNPAPVAPVGPAKLLAPVKYTNPAPSLTRIVPVGP